MTQNDLLFVLALAGYILSACFAGAIFYVVFKLEDGNQSAIWLGALWPFVTAGIIAATIVFGSAYFAMKAGWWFGERIKELVAKLGVDNG